MLLSKLESLPTELLQQICEYLDSRDQRNLTAFGRASKTCKEASLPCLYRTVRFEVPWPVFNETSRFPKHGPRLAPCVKHWQALLERDHAHHHVLCVKISEPRQAPLLEESCPRWLRHCARCHEARDLLDSDDEFADPPERDVDASYFSYKARESESDLGSQGVSYAPWPALSAFLLQLPALRDFRFDCSQQLPECLLDVLLRIACNLHLDRFLFEECVGKHARLRKPPTGLDLQLASIRSLASRYGALFWKTWAHKAIASIFEQPRPGLVNLSLLHDYQPSGFRQTFVEGDYSALLQRFQETNNVPQRHRAQLQSLSIGGVGPICGTQMFDILQQQCDLTRLEFLRLELSGMHRGLDLLMRNNTFESLTTLVIGVEITNTYWKKECDERDLSAAFIESLPPLRSLRFVEAFTADAVGAALARHGASLERLWFPPPATRRNHTSAQINYFDSTKVADLVDRCPALRDLILTIPRSMGDAIEVQMYRSLGSIPKLQRLSLSLDCEDTTLELGVETDEQYSKIYPSFDNFDLEFTPTEMMTNVIHHRCVRNGHVRIGMINAALDEGLARSIFDTISSAKPATGATFSLEHLELMPIRGGYTEEACEVAETVGIWWLLERGQRDDRRDCIRAIRLRYPGDILTERFGPPTKLACQAEPIFRKVWPSTGGNWSEDWYSWPLAL